MSRKSAWHSLTSNGALALAGLTGVTALALHSVAALAVGGSALVAVVAWDALGDRARAPSVGACKVRPPEAFRDAHTRAVVAAIHAAHRALSETLARGARPLPVELDGAFDAVAQLERHADALAARAEEIAGHLERIDAAALHRDASTLGRRAEGARDAETRAHYEAARASRVAHVSALSELGRSKERIAAVLLAIAATLEAMPARVLQARGLGTGADVARDVRRELDNVTIEIASMEDTISTLEETNA
jgi:hypothetical protein